MQARPVRLNATVATLFMVGSSCFALGSVPAYASAVGAGADRGDVLHRLAVLHLGVVRSAAAGADAGHAAQRRHRDGWLAAARPRLAAARPSMARCRDAVPRHAVLQRQHRLGDRPEPVGERGRPARLASGPLRLGALPRVQQLCPAGARSGSGADGCRRRGRGGSAGSTWPARSRSWPQRSPRTSFRPRAPSSTRRGPTAAPSWARSASSWAPRSCSPTWRVEVSGSRTTGSAGR